MIALFLLHSCQQVAPCEEGKKFFSGKKLNIIVTDRGKVGNLFDVKGYDPNTGKKISYHDIHGMYVFVRDSTQIGDTLVKDSEQAKFTIKKHYYNLVLEMVCDGHNYLPVQSYREQK